VREYMLKGAIYLTNKVPKAHDVWDKMMHVRVENCVSLSSKTLSPEQLNLWIPTLHD